MPYIPILLTTEKYQYEKRDQRFQLDQLNKIVDLFVEIKLLVEMKLFVEMIDEYWHPIISSPSNQY